LKQLLQKTLALLNHREKKRLRSLIIQTVLISVADIASLAILLYIIDFYTRTTPSPPASWLPAWLLNKQSILLITLFFVLFCVKNWAAYRIFKAQYQFVYEVASRIAHNNMVRYLEGSYAHYIHTDSSTHIRNICLQPLDFAQHILAPWQQVITELILVTLAIIAIVLFNATLFVLLLAILLPPVIITAYLTKKKLTVAGNYIKESREKMWQHLQEAIGGFVESNIYDRTAFFADRYATAQNTLNQHQATLQSTQGIPARLAEVFAVFGLLALIAISHASGSPAYTPTIVTLGAFTAAAYKIIPGISRMLNGVAQIRTYAFTIDGLMQTASMMANRPAGKTMATINGITCRDVGFSYNGTPILRQVNFNLQPGDMLGIQGVSGKGKTTMLNILLGFTDPSEGDILINNASANNHERQQYWPAIAYVKQQPFLLHDTLLANITMGETPHDVKKLQQVIATTGLTALQARYMDDTSTLITEHGKNISGGQRQRIAMARALYKDASLLILDEPFSELDETAEEELLHYCRQLAAAGKMIILITHHSKSLSLCNKVIALP
jgi:ABC-type multidrug transport system fused ATPase/permease subunit